MNDPRQLCHRSIGCFRVVPGFMFYLSSLTALTKEKYLRSPCGSDPTVLGDAWPHGDSFAMAINLAQGHHIATSVREFLDGLRRRNSSVWASDWNVRCTKKEVTASRSVHGSLALTPDTAQLIEREMARGHEKERPQFAIGPVSRTRTVARSWPTRCPRVAQRGKFRWSQRATETR